MDKHVTVVGVLFIMFGALGVFGALIVLVALVVLPGDEEATWASIVGLSIAGSFLLFEAVKIVGGIALLQRRPWARIL